jgi:hypothetical protein
VLDRSVFVSKRYAKILKNIPHHAPLELLSSRNTPERKLFIWEKIFLHKYEQERISQNIHVK